MVLAEPPEELGGLNSRLSSSEKGDSEAGDTLCCCGGCGRRTRRGMRLRDTSFSGCAFCSSSGRKEGSPPAVSARSRPPPLGRALRRPRRRAGGGLRPPGGRGLSPALPRRPRPPRSGRRERRRLRRGAPRGGGGGSRGPSPSPRPPPAALRLPPHPGTAAPQPGSNPGPAAPLFPQPEFPRPRGSQPRSPPLPRSPPVSPPPAARTPPQPFPARLSPCRFPAGAPWCSVTAQPGPGTWHGREGRAQRLLRRPLRCGWRSPARPRRSPPRHVVPPPPPPARPPRGAERGDRLRLRPGSGAALCCRCGTGPPRAAAAAR